MAEACDFRAVKGKIRDICKQRRLRLEEFMRTFDLHHTKKIRVEQFKRALDVSGLQLSSCELNTILIKYRNASDPTSIDYRRFCDLIDKVFTVKGMEAHPLLKSYHNGSPSKPRGSSPGKVDALLSEVEKQELAVIKQKLQSAVLTKGIVLKDVFHDFDRSNSGKVTKTQFLRDLLDIVTLSSNEVETLLKFYSDGPLDVNYRVLHHDIAIANGSDSASQTTQPGSPARPQRVSLSSTHRNGNQMSSNADEALQQLEAELVETTSRDRIRLKNFFTDYDQLRSGKCSEAQFKRSIKLCFPFLTELELELLVDKYRSEAKVDYMRFCHCMEGKPGDSSLSSLSSSSSSTTNKCSRELRGEFDSEKQHEVYSALMDRLSNFVATRRVLMKPLFQDFDKPRQECVTKQQFQRVLVILKMDLLFVNEKAELQLLFRRYQSNHGDNFVNYVSFCHDIELACSEKEGITSENFGDQPENRKSNCEPDASQPIVRSLPMLLRYIKQVVKRDRIRLEEFFRDFDKLRHYKVTRAQFASGLNEASNGVLVLLPEEMELLSSGFAAPDARDAQGNCFVHWKSFVEEIETVFTVKELETAPSRDLSDLREKTLLLSPSNQGRGCQEVQETKVLELMQSILRSMQQQRLDIKPAFEDFDRSKQGFITSSKFERVLSMFHLLPSDAQLARMLALKFREDSSTCTSGVSMDGRGFGSVCDVNYRAFLNALELLRSSGEPGSPLGSSIKIPSTNEYRQQLFASNGSNMEGLKRATREIELEISTDRTMLQALLMDLRQQIDTKRIRLKEFLVEGDKLRSGEISLAKFHTALNRSGCNMDSKDINLLNANFQSSKHSDRIDWRRFLEAIDRASAGSMTSSSSICVTSPKIKVEKSVEDEEQEKQRIQKLLQIVKNKVSHRRLNMKPYFQDYDQNKMCRVTKFQFAAVLNMMQLALKQAEIDLLSDHFAVCVGRKKLTDVNYVQFIQQVDEEFNSDE